MSMAAENTPSRGSGEKRADALPYRAVACDLDDTVLREDLSISDRTLETLRRLDGMGVRILPASGRARLSMQPFVDQIGCAELFIACNGAEIWDNRTGELLHAEQFSTERGREIAAFGNRHHC